MYGVYETLPTITSLAGIPPETLRTWLTQAQTALFTLNIGGQPISVSYSQSDGSRSVTYKTTDIASLTNFIMQLLAALGVRARRPLRPTYF